MVKLDSVRLEIIRLRAQLLSEEELTPAEKGEMRVAEREIAAGKTVTLKEFLKEIKVKRYYTHCSTVAQPIPVSVKILPSNWRTSYRCTSP